MNIIYTQGLHMMAIRQRYVYVNYYQGVCNWKVRKGCEHVRYNQVLRVVQKKNQIN